MNRLSLPTTGLFVFALLLAGLTTTPANAVKPFRDEFKVIYIKADSQEPKDVALREAFEKASCSLCHVGDDKEQRNAYGQALDKLLDRKTDAKNKEKIKEALEKVAGMKIDPNDPKSPTYGELISQGKLPLGEK